MRIQNLVFMFLKPDSSAATLDLAIWGTQLNAFILFIISWSGILGGALRGAGDTYGAMTIFATFWWFQFLLVLMEALWAKDKFNNFFAGELRVISHYLMT